MDFTYQPVERYRAIMALLLVNVYFSLNFKVTVVSSESSPVLYTECPLTPARWHGKHTYLSSLGMLGITQVGSILFADHITFNNGYMKHAHTRQRMSNNNNNNKKKQV